MMDSEQKTSEFQNKINQAVSEQNLEIEKIQTALDKDEVEITKKKPYKKIDELRSKPMIVLKKFCLIFCQKFLQL